MIYIHANNIFALVYTKLKFQVEIPAKYAKRRQPIADGSKGPMNIGAVAVMPEGWKLAPKDRLPKPLKKLGHS